MSQRAVAGLVVITALGLATGAVADDPYFMGLGDLPGGDYWSFAEAISADGSTVVGSGITNGPSLQAFRWTQSSGMVGLGYLPGGETFSQGRDVSANGSVVVGGARNSAMGNEAFRWTEAGGMVGLGDLPGGEFDSGASGVSASGSVVVGSGHSANGQEAFRWTADSGMVGLGDLPGGDFLSVATAASGDGNVAVGTSDSGGAPWGHEAFRWTLDDGMVGLGDLPGGRSESQALNVSSDGKIVVGTSASYTAGDEAFLWTEAGGMEALGHVPGGTASVAYAVSDNGGTVVGYAFQDRRRAFIWERGAGMRVLQDVLTDDYGLSMTGWNLSWAYDVSADGRTFAGSGVNPNGDGEAWVAHIPEPATSWLFGFSVLVIARGARLSGRPHRPRSHGHIGLSRAIREPPIRTAVRK